MLGCRMCSKNSSNYKFYSCKFLGGLETEKAYPYEAVNDECKFHKSKVRVYINDSVALPPDEEKMAAWLVSHGPISIGINANAMQVIVTCILLLINSDVFGV